MIVTMIEKVYSFLWGDLIRIPLPGGSTLGISLLILLLIPTGIYFTIRTKLLPIRLFPDMVRALSEKKSDKKNLSAFQTLIVSTATRVGMGNLVGVVAAISAGGAGAVFWMWITALIGSSTAFIEATLAQLYKEKDPLYGGYRGGPAYYIHRYWEEKQGRKRKKVLLSVLFAISGLICWCGISQVISNSVTASFKNAFDIPPLYTTIVLVVIAAVIVLRKNATVKVLDILVPVMAVLYFVITLFIIFTNLGSMPGVFKRIFEEAFGFRQAAAGGFGVVLMNGVKRGLFSNEAGSGSAPCAAAAAESGKSRICPGPGCICGYDRDLQLYSHDYASGTGGSGTGTFRNGTSSDCHALSYGTVWSDLYCCNTVYVQLFHIPGNPVLCKRQCVLSFWG